MLENNYFNLFLEVPDTDLAKIIEEAQNTGAIYDLIYQQIEKDLDRKGLQKKKERVLDQKYIDRQTGSLSDELEESEMEYNPKNLETGRPRITAEEVFIFICLHAYLDSATSREAVERIVESQSLYIYLPVPSSKLILSSFFSRHSALNRQ